MAESEEVHPHAAKLKNKDGAWKYSNALVDQTSPYLLQHAHNPVDWYPWGAQAFELARKTGKPIFLSVGYATCYWCHVMERQVFEDPAQAAVLNEHFISIKVDREEMPHVDDVYMTAVQLIMQRGGWPMSLFLTPPGAKGEDDHGLAPFFAGTYIPPEPRYGMPGFTQLVLLWSERWRDDRAQVLDYSDKVVAAVQAQLGKRDAGGQLELNVASGAAEQIFLRYDAVDGGFGPSPKFPSPTSLMLLLKDYQRQPRAELWQALAHTLERMARGGMYDQVGGGFHRYSTDGQWLVPHFEKMLYDNALLIETYLTAQSIQPHAGDPGLYPRIVRQTCDYVLREMTDAPGRGGAFWSAQDAEVDAREGANYLWLPAQVNEAIGEARLAKVAQQLYGLDGGTNFKDPHDAKAPRANVLFVPEPFDKLAAELGMSLAELLEAQESINAKLLAVRDQRKQPRTDDKILVAWNGLMIAALARAGRELGESRYTQAAAKAADTILEQMSTPDGGLYRTMRLGKVKDIPAFLEDYSFMMHGLIELHRSDQAPRWLKAADRLLTFAEARFADGEGGYFDTEAGQGHLFVRVRSTWDGAIPTPCSVLAHDLIDLYELTEDESYLDRAVQLLASFAGSLRQGGPSMAHMQHALLRAIDMAPAKVAGAGHVPVSPRGPVVFRSVKVEPGTIDTTAGPVTVRVKLDIVDEYHLNSNEAHAEAGTIITTSLALEGAPELTLDVVYPPGKQKKFPFATEPLSIYEGQVEIVVTISPNGAAPAGQSRPRLVLNFQACTDTACLMPSTIELPLKFK